jgi:hypothetical protein
MIGWEYPTLHWRPPATPGTEGVEHQCQVPAPGVGGDVAGGIHGRDDAPGEEDDVGGPERYWDMYVNRVRVEEEVTTL